MEENPNSVEVEGKIEQEEMEFGCGLGFEEDKMEATSMAKAGASSEGAQPMRSPIKARLLPASLQILQKNKELQKIIKQQQRKLMNKYKSIKPKRSKKEGRKKTPEEYSDDTYLVEGEETGTRRFKNDKAYRRDLECCVEGCTVTGAKRRRFTFKDKEGKNKKRDRKYQIFQLPTEGIGGMSVEDRQKLWIEFAVSSERQRQEWVTQITELEIMGIGCEFLNFRVCEKHFEKGQPTPEFPNPTITSVESAVLNRHIHGGSRRGVGLHIYKDGAGPSQQQNSEQFGLEEEWNDVPKVHSKSDSVSLSMEVSEKEEEVEEEDSVVDYNLLMGANDDQEVKELNERNALLNEKLIGLVRQTPCLWNCADPIYQDEEKKQEAWRKIHAKLPVFKSIRSLRSRWQYLKEYYRNIISNLFSAEDNSEGSEKKTNKWIHLDDMKFLQPVFTANPSLHSDLSSDNSSRCSSPSSAEPGLRYLDSLTSFKCMVRSCPVRSRFRNPQPYRFYRLSKRKVQRAIWFQVLKDADPDFVASSDGNRLHNILYVCERHFESQYPYVAQMQLPSKNLDPESNNDLDLKELDCVGEWASSRVKHNWNKLSEGKVLKASPGEECKCTVQGCRVENGMRKMATDGVGASVVPYTLYRMPGYGDLRRRWFEQLQREGDWVGNSRWRTYVCERHFKDPSVPDLPTLHLSFPPPKEPPVVVPQLTQLTRQTPSPPTPEGEASSSGGKGKPIVKSIRPDITLDDLDPETQPRPLTPSEKGRCAVIGCPTLNGMLIKEGNVDRPCIIYKMPTRGILNLRWYTALKKGNRNWRSSKRNNNVCERHFNRGCNIPTRFLSVENAMDVADEVSTAKQKMDRCSKSPGLTERETLSNHMAVLRQKFAAIEEKERQKKAVEQAQAQLIENKRPLTPMTNQMPRPPMQNMQTPSTPLSRQDPWCCDVIVPVRAALARIEGRANMLHAFLRAIYTDITGEDQMPFGSLGMGIGTGDDEPTTDNAELMYRVIMAQSRKHKQMQNSGSAFIPSTVDSVGSCNLDVACEEEVRSSRLTNSGNPTTMNYLCRPTRPTGEGSFASIPPSGHLETAESFPPIVGNQTPSQISDNTQEKSKSVHVEEEKKRPYPISVKPPKTHIEFMSGRETTTTTTSTTPNTTTPTTTCATSTSTPISTNLSEDAKKRKMAYKPGPLSFKKRRLLQLKQQVPNVVGGIPKMDGDTTDRDSSDQELILDGNVPQPVLEPSATAKFKEGEDLSFYLQALKAKHDREFERHYPSRIPWDSAEASGSGAV